MNILGIVAIISALVSSGGTYWAMSNYYDAKKLAELVAVQEHLEEKLEEVRNIEELYFEEQGKEKIRYKEVIKYVKTYIPAVQSHSSQCNLTYGTLKLLNRRHNALPEPSPVVNPTNRPTTQDRAL